MSEENVEIVREAWDALGRGDLDAAEARLAPDAEIDQTRAVGMDRGTFTVKEFRRRAEQFIDAWDSTEWAADEFIDAGPHVVMPFTNRMRGRDGIEVRARGVIVWTVRDGLIVRYCLYQDRREALEAAGLSE
jgi:ketosteroid isomerase-like protein